MSPKSFSLKTHQQNEREHHVKIHQINHEKIAEKRKAVELQLRRDELIISSTMPRTRSGLDTYTDGEGIIARRPAVAASTKKTGK